ncbi:D(2) dopamine receptor [Elysia marginata]|uniref:D(2) dopamine receptor n=1 Tax=Elysia marginata TaxID=1093978 RepID=A0AAV4J716_9GAST|nr:D(2) dopamine receptor [Elysia marginata]
MVGQNTTSRVWPNLNNHGGGVDPLVDAANNRTEFTSMTAVGLNTVVAAAVLFNNIVLLITIGRTRKLWTSTNVFTSLAAADLLLGIMMVVRNFWVIPETAWVFHNYEYVCMPIVCLLYVSCLESITCLAMVSLDRYAYIVWPFWYERHVTKGLITTSIALSWVVCIAIGFLPMRLNKFTVDSGCDPLSIISEEYLLYGLNLYLFGAEVLIAAMYGRIYCVGNQQRKKIEAATGGNLRQRFNSKSSEKSVCNSEGDGSDAMNGGYSVGRWVKPRATTVAVIDATRKDEKTRFENGNNLDSQATDLSVCNALGRAASANDMELSGSGKGVPPRRVQSMVDETVLQSERVESTGNFRKRSLLDRVAKLKKIKRFSFSSTKESIASRWQVIRFLVLVCGTFFLCWTPLQIISILYFTVGTPVIAISIGITFAAINSALNLYILIAMNKTFKTALLKMVCPSSYFSRGNCPHKRRKGDMDFISDYNPAPRTGLPVTTGVTIAGETPHSNGDIFAGNSLPQHRDSVEKEERCLQQNAYVVIEDICPQESMAVATIETGSLDSGVVFPQHFSNDVAVEVSQQRFVNLEKLSSQQAGSEPEREVCSQHTDSETKGSQRVEEKVSLQPADYESQRGVSSQQVDTEPQTRLSSQHIGHTIERAVSSQNAD